MSIFYNPLTLCMTMWGDLRAGNICSKLKFVTKISLQILRAGCER